MLRDHLTPRRAWILGIGLWLAFSCAVQREPGGPQGWWAEHGPVVPHELFPADCSLCHEGDGWRKIRDDFSFDHAAETGVALEGAHARAECLRCHNDRGPAATFVARGCVGCHQDPHRGQLGQDCSTCHDQENWRPKEVFTEHARTRFPLVGAHVATACWRCHPGAQVGNFARADTECLACHQGDLARATNPDHAAMGWTDCERCHLPTAWNGSAFVHPWPLTGRHASLDCNRCHAGNVYAGTPDQCVDCHLAEYQGVNDPDHVMLGFSTDCQDCHGTSTWSGARFSHTGITSNCVDCHLADYQATTNPNHVDSGFGTRCEECHRSTTNWNSANFDHDQFPLRGSHRSLNCTDCHLNPATYSSFSCTHCHEHNQSDMARKHREVGSYTWSSPRCYECHRNGRGDD